MAEFISDLLIRHRRLFFAAALIILTIMAIFSDLPVIDSRLAGYNIQGNPYETAREKMDSLFSHRSIIQVLVKPENTATGTFLKGLRTYATEVKKIFPEARIESLADPETPVYRLVNESTPVSRMLAAARGIPLAGDLVSNDTSSILVLIEGINGEDFDSERFSRLLNLQYPGIKEMKAMSLFHIQESIEASIKKDYFVLLPVIILFTALFIYFAYGKLTAVAFCLINVSVSFIPVLFFLTLSHVNINQITASALPVVIILSLSASVHLVTGYLSGHGNMQKTELMKESIRCFFTPSLLSSLTTAIAFGSFIFSDSEYIRQFGLVTATGIMAVFLISYLISPFTINLIRPGFPERSGFHFISGLEKFLLHNRKILVFLFSSAVVISPFLISGIKFNTNPETYIPRNTDIFKNAREIREAFHSIAEIDMLISKKGNLAATDRQESSYGALANATAELSRKFSEYPEIASVKSFKDLIQFENSYSFLGFPSKIFPRSGNPYVSADRMTLRVNMKLKDTDGLKRLLGKIEEDFGKYKNDFTYSLFSEYLYFDYISSSITRSLLRSLLFSAIPIFLILILLARNLRSSLISILSNLPPLALLVILFSLTGLEMNITTSITLVICLGLIVDDTIQILYRRTHLNRQLSELGYSVLTTSILLAGGFFSFILSSSQPNRIFGLLSAMVFLAAAVSDIVIMSWLEGNARKDYLIFKERSDK